MSLLHEAIVAEKYGFRLSVDKMAANDCNARDVEVLRLTCESL